MTWPHTTDNADTADTTDTTADTADTAPHRTETHGEVLDKEG